MKRPDRKADSSPDEPILTSASIRGPEDFDMFVQGADTMKYTLTPETVRDKPKVSPDQSCMLDEQCSLLDEMIFASDGVKCQKY